MGLECTLKKKYINVGTTYSNGEPDLRWNNVSEDRSGDSKSTYLHTSEQEIQNHLAVL